LCFPKKLHWFLKAPSILIFLQHKKFFANNKGTAGIGASKLALGVFYENSLH